MNKEELTGIIQSAIDGDESAFERLMEAYARYILAYARGLTPTDQDAEDMAQEIAIAVWRGIGTLQTPFAFTVWLKRVCFNTCMNYADRLKRGQGADVPIDEAELLPEEDDEKLPERHVVNEDEKSRLYALIGALPPSQNSALFLYYYEEMSYKEIAELQGVRVGTVATNIRKAKDNLKKRLEKEPGSERRSESSEETGLEKMSSVAFGTMIGESIRRGTDGFVSDQTVSRFMTRVYHADKSAWGRATAQPQHAAGVKGWLLLVCACAAAVIVTIAAVSSQVATPKAPLVAPSSTLGNSAPDYVYDATNAEIQLTSNDAQGGHVNPVRGEIAVNDNTGTAKGWRITEGDMNGKLVTSGDGAAADIPQNLAPGTYTLSFDVVSGTATSVVSRVFYVENA